MSDLLLPQHLDAFCHYLATSEGVFLVRYAANHTILTASHSFLNQMPNPEAAIGESIGRFVGGPDGRDCSLLATAIAELPVSFTAKIRPTQRTYHCHLHPDGTGYLLIGERLAANETESLERMSLMTNELATLTLELRKRNADLEQANETIRELTRVDPLTNLANRRRFAEALDAAMAVARRHRQPLALIGIDIDRFKSVNDTHGHDTGDEVLREFAALLKESCRSEDLPVRLGGEEFLLLAPNTAVDEAYALAERLRVKTSSVTMPKGVHITLSLGVTQLLAQDTYFAFMKRTDMALYEAKSGGRNKTVVRMTNDPKA
ncbi:MAG: GGDEF domain-containing protein [Lentisphaerae bacterium]|nr:GGDEF domain-containing protein [Lentisphaerota bacterium]